MGWAFFSFGMSCVAVATLLYAFMSTNVFRRSVFDVIDVNEMSFMAIIVRLVVAYVATMSCK